MPMTDEQIERFQHEMVFGLGGGELHIKNPKWPDPWDGIFAYWYEGAPEYDTEHSKDYDSVYRTAIVCRLFGPGSCPPGYEEVAYFLSSGETMCYHDNEHDTEDVVEDCQICGGDGYVYLGEGMCEVLYRQLPADEDGEDPPTAQTAIPVAGD